MTVYYLRIEPVAFRTTPYPLFFTVAHASYVS
uniref:Uncharacterized protein n=1 Tax=Anguilla anguilla TaxID=7936 RepID=A0A0E9QGB1_ANGAN